MIRDRKYPMHWLTMASMAGMIAACSNNPRTTQRLTCKPMSQKSKASKNLP